MGKHAFTPGPWRMVSSSKSYWEPYQIEAANGCCLVAFGSSGVNRANARADALLMAAAPELLEALINCRSLLAAHTTATDPIAALADVKARAAIAKATGEPA